jgi:hypothetical protein
MALSIVVWVLLFVISYFIFRGIKQSFPRLDNRFMIQLFFYHAALAGVYYLYAQFNPSDSINYFQKALQKVHGENWLDYFGNSTRFVDFITFSLVNHLGFTYEACMVFFSWLGFLGFIFFYIFFTEQIQTPIKLFGQPVVKLLLLLPNLHFWSASIGKGALMFLGFGLFFYALTRPSSRIWALALGGWFIFQIRPHIFYVVLIAITIGFAFSTKGLAVGYRIVVLSLSAFLLYYIYDDILQFAGLEDDSLLNPMFSHRANELSKATSGIDISNYSAPEKLFAFCFRPLFFDANGILGFIVSFENAFYLTFFLRLLQPRAIRFLFASDAIVKTSFITFLGVAYALAQISGNLGLAMRQKSQVMLLMLFVIAKYMDDQKMQQYKSWWNVWRRRQSFNIEPTTSSRLS